VLGITVLGGVQLHRAEASSPVILSLSKNLEPPDERGLVDAQEFHFEDQRRIWRNHTAGALLAIAQAGRNRELADAADFHPGHALIPALDNLPGSQLKCERLPVVLRRIKLRPVRQPPRVMDRHTLAGFRDRPRADLLVFHFQLGRTRGRLRRRICRRLIVTS